MATLAYPLVLTQDDNGSILVTCPDLPEVTTFGEDKGDAVLRAVDAIEEAIAARIANRESVPEASPAHGKPVVSLPTETVVKVELYRTMDALQMRKADLARLLNLHGPQVDRLLDIRHGTRFDQLDRALAALGKKVEIRITDSAETTHTA